MPIYLTVLWIAGIASVTLVGSWYAKRYGKPDLLFSLYVAFVLISQILATKVASFDLGFDIVFGPAGAIVFAVTFLLTDIVNEKFGRAETHRMIFIGFITQVAMVFFFWLGIKLTPAPFWQNQDVWAKIFGAVPRITIASWAAFLVSENFDAYAFDWVKKFTKGKHLWMRNVFSSIPALALDSLIFIPLAFGGILPIWSLIWGQIWIKWLAGLVCIPFMYINRRVMK